MEKILELTLTQLKSLFIAGEEFEKQTIEFDMGERDKVDALDFGDYMKKLYNIDV